jgi:endonuclease III
MPRISSRAIARHLVQTRGRLFSEELGIDLAANTPEALFCWLVAALLFSARIGAGAALAAAEALFEEGWTTAERMAAAGWEARTRALNRSGYARYDESTSRMLGDASALIVEAHGGDLRKLRQAAGRKPEEERRLLKQFKGIGDVGADIFCREAQTVWDELYPFADARALAAARALGLGETAGELAGLVSKRDFPRLAAALVRTALAKDFAEFREPAAK